MKKKVLLRGPVLTQSGYGVHARQVASWLLNRDDLDVEFQALPWGDTPWLIDEKSHDGFIGRILEKTSDPSGKVYDVTVQLQLPNEWDEKLGKVNIGITAAVETDRCNPDWIHSCNKMTSIVVPSDHARRCLAASGDLRVPIRVIPEAYNDQIIKHDRPDNKIDSLDFSTPFNFLVFGQITGNNPENDRKNMFYTVKWFCEAFKSDPSVGLIIKTNGGRNSTFDRRNITSLMSNVVGESRKNSLIPRIYIVHGNLSDEEVGSLYRHKSVKALLSLTRGEGFGLPLLEAAVCELPVIATGWSGHVEYLSQGKYIDISYKLDEIHQSRIDDKIFMKGSKWAAVDESDVKKKLLKFRASPDIPKQWAVSLSEKLRSSHSLSSITARYQEAFKDSI